MDIMRDNANEGEILSPVTLTEASFLTTTVQVTAAQSSTVAMFGADSDSMLDAGTTTSIITSASSRYVPLFSLQSIQQTTATDQSVEAIGNNAPTVSAASPVDQSQSTDSATFAGVSPTVVEPSTTANPTFITVSAPTQTQSSIPTSVITTRATPAATSSGDPHSAIKNSPVVPIIASIVPLVIIAVCAFLYLSWRRQRKLHKQIRMGLEEDAAWDAGQNPATSNDSTSTIRPPRSYGSVRATNQAVRHSRTNSARQSMRYKPYPSTLNIRKHPHNPMWQGPRQTSISRLEDPFATPTSETFPTNVHAFADEFRASQIGLAITTPHHRNTSNASVANTIRTVLHHASRHVSNPFGDPSTSNSRESVVQPRSENTVPIQPQTSFLVPSQSSKSQKSVSSAATKSGNLTKSDTPPEELARRWIEVLKMEAAQANEAAEEAAKRAVELRKEDGAKYQSNLNGYAAKSGEK